MSAGLDFVSKIGELDEGINHVAAVSAFTPTPKEQSSFPKGACLRLLMAGICKAGKDCKYSHGPSLLKTAWIEQEKNLSYQNSHPAMFKN